MKPEMPGFDPLCRQLQVAFFECKRSLVSVQVIVCLCVLHIYNCSWIPDKDFVEEKGTDIFNHFIVNIYKSVVW